MSFNKKLLCAAYLTISFVALIACWRENFHYLPDQANGLGHFILDTFGTPASRSITYDLCLLFISASIWMVSEAKRLNMKYVWLYLIFGLIIAISVTFPLFLIARERQLTLIRA